MCRAVSKNARVCGRKTAPKLCCRRGRASAWLTRCSWTSSSVSNHPAVVGEVRLAGGAGRVGGRAGLGRREGPRVTTAVPAFRAAGLTDVGAQRVVNEDRFFCDG